jgi:hypothetical protein
MFEYLKDLFKTLIDFINNENYVNFIGMIVVSVSSYQIAKYNASRPNRLKIKQLQLSNVYLPLYRIFDNLPSSPSPRQTIDALNKITNVLDKNYELVFPQFHSLNKTLRSDLIKNDDYQKVLKIMRHQVNTDYELLKKSLGYPSENFYDIFIRMTFKQKATFIVSWFNLLCITILPLLFAMLLSFFNKFSTSILVPAFASFPVIFIFMWRINKWLNSLKD